MTKLNSFYSDKKTSDISKIPCPYCGETRWFQDTLGQVKHCMICKHWWLTEDEKED